MFGSGFSLFSGWHAARAYRKFQSPLLTEARMYKGGRSRRASLGTRVMGLGLVVLAAGGLMGFALRFSLDLLYYAVLVVSCGAGLLLLGGLVALGEAVWEELRKR